MPLLANALLPMVVTLDGIVTPFNAEQLKNARYPIVVNTPSNTIVPTPSVKVLLTMLTLNALGTGFTCRVAV